MERIQTTESLAEQAYQIIKNAIVNGELKDAAPLPEQKMASQLGISRTPLRDALNKLAIEGLVIQRKNAPAIVAGFSKEKSLEFIEIRLLLESANIERITPLMTKKTLNELRKNLKVQAKMIADGSYTGFLEQDREFHLILANANPNEEMRKLIHQINTGVSRAFIILSNTISQSAEGAYEEHQEIIRALEAKDIDRAKATITQHVQNVRDRFLTLKAT